MPNQRDQRLPVRLFNSVSRLLERLGRSRASFAESEETLHEAARKAAGYDDFGDPSYLDGLRVLLRAYDEESHLNPFGRVMVNGELTRILTNRLRVQKSLAENPSIGDAEVRRPIFILGLPRTGTTALHHLLGPDPDNPVLEYWLAAGPGPRPPRAEWESDPRFKEAVRDLKTMYFLDPSLKAIHLMTADGPEECRHLLCQSFTDDTFECNATVPSYSRFYENRDMRASYRRHREVLQVVGSPEPGRRWVLKYPAHMRHLRTLLEVYPDACIVQTHRDPGRVLPSLCSLIAGWRGIYEDDPDRKAIGQWQLDQWTETMSDAMAARSDLDPARFFDLHFREIVADPIDAIRRMYAHFDLELTPGGERRIDAWRAANPRGKHGEHRYTAEEFGFSPGLMAERFADYTSHYGVEAEQG